MQIFSTEYLDSLTAEHKFITASINRMTHNSGFRTMYSSRYGQEAFDAVKNNLIIKRLELEIKIDELSDYLKG